MLYLVLGLVLAAFGLLIAALTTANTLFAWVSVVVSVLAAGLLVFDWLNGRRRAREAAEEAEPDPVLARPEQPFGDQTPPLTETRRRVTRREERAGLREEARDATRDANRSATAEPEDEPDFEPNLEPEPDFEPEPAAERRSGVEPEPATKRKSSFEPVLAFEPEFRPEPEGGRKPLDKREPAAEQEPAVRREQEAAREPERPAVEAVPADSPSAMVADAADSKADAADPQAAAAGDARADAVASAAGEGSPTNGSEPDDLREAEPARTGPPRDERPAERQTDRPADRQAGEDQPREERTAVLSGRRAQEARRTVVDEHGEPGEEPTDATDLLIVTDLQDEVRVVDEHPRYHLAACTFLLDRPTIPLPISEARQLGFTPCIRCGPDATLAARHRATR